MKKASSTYVETSKHTTASTLSPPRPGRLLTLLASGTWPVWAWASGTSGDLPWNNFLDKLQSNITGPTATALIFIAIAGALVVWSMSDDHRGLIRFGKALGALATLAALGALLSVLGISGATV